MPREGFRFDAKGTPAAIAGLLCDALLNGAPFVYADTDDASLRTALRGELARVGAERGIAIESRPFKGSVLAWSRRTAPKEVAHAA